MNNNYFIKEGYKPNLYQRTYDSNSNEKFWNENRLKSAKNLQYYVYHTCNKLILKNNFNKIMDVGCGPPMKIRNMFDLAKIDLTLIDQPSIEKHVKRIIPYARFISLNLENPDINLGEKFQMIICSDVIEHLLEPDNCIKFIKKHIDIKGLVIFSTPERDYRRGISCMSCNKKEHIREWNKREFALYIESHGFRIIKHLLFPQMKINYFIFILSRILKGYICNPKYYSCQTVVCTI